MTTKRKPYVREMKPTWWKSLNFYKLYILRESTAIAAVWFSIVLIYGAFAMGNGVQGVVNFVSFLQNPIVLLLNIATLAATLFHTKTWFESAPKAADIVINGKKVPACIKIKVLWGTTALATIIILALALS